jgi:hypothetical protein
MECSARCIPWACPPKKPAAARWPSPGPSTVAKECRHQDAGEYNWAFSMIMADRLAFLDRKTGGTAIVYLCVKQVGSRIARTASESQTQTENYAGRILPGCRHRLPGETVTTI